MLIPFFTVFNPFFTDLFLRLTDSTVLWRFCFLIPIHYVAADFDLVVKLLALGVVIVFCSAANAEKTRCKLKHPKASQLE